MALHGDFGRNKALHPSDTTDSFNIFLKSEDALQVFFAQQRIILLDENRDSFADLIFFIQPVEFFCLGVSRSEETQEVGINFEAEKGSQGNDIQDGHQNNDYPGLSVDKVGNSLHGYTLSGRFTFLPFLN